MPPTYYGNLSPDIEQRMILAAIQSSMEDKPKSSEEKEQIIKQKYSSSHGGSGAHRFDSHFRNLNDVITKSRLPNKDEGPCMVLDTADDSGSDTMQSQSERARHSRAFRIGSPDNIHVSKKSKFDSDDDVMITSPKYRAGRRKIPSDSDSDDDDMAGSSKLPHKFRNYDNGYDSESDGEFEKLLSKIDTGCVSDDVYFCGFANDCSKCYRNSLLWVLLSCDMLLEKIREHKKQGLLPRCSEFDEFLLLLYDKCQTNKTISIDEEFENSKCLKINTEVMLQGATTFSSYAEQSPTEYLGEMFRDCENTTHVTKQLMSHRILSSKQRTNSDKSITWTTFVLQDFIHSASCKVVDESCFNNVERFDIKASGKDMDAELMTMNITMKLPDIWCLDAANNEVPKFAHQFTLSAPKMKNKDLLSRGVYQIIGCVSHSEIQHHYVACIFKNNQWVCMVCFSFLIQIFHIYTQRH